MDQLIKDYLAWAEQHGLAATTRYCRGRSLARLAARLPVPLIEATPEHLTAWRATLRPLCNQTINNYVTDARCFYAWSIMTGRRADNPAAGLPVPRCGRRLPRPVSAGDLCQAILTAPPRVRPWLVLAAFTGLRAKEIALLRRECVLDQAGEPAILIAADATKGDNEHLVPMIGLVLAELRRAGMPRQGWMFGRADGQPGPNTPHTISRTANRHLREWGVTLHQLRHYFATAAYDVSNDLLALAEMLGHRGLDMVRNYAKVSMAKKVQIVAGIPVPPQLQAA
jgi:integrase